MLQDKQRAPGPEAMRSFPLTLFALVLAGGAVALAGGYWDDAWHTERGRDSFFIAPHIALYSGVTVAGAAFAVWLAQGLRAHGRREALRHPAILLGLGSVAVTLAAGPVDDAWHRAFGRDAVIWSPPHTLGIVAMGCLGLAALLAVADERGRRGLVLRALAGGFVVAAFNSLLMEYETDVPQFAMLWYLPVLALTSSLAMALVKLANPDPLAATFAAAAHVGYIALVGLFLEAKGFDAPLLPVLIVAAAALDLGVARRWPLPLLAGAYVLALVAAYLPSINLLSFGISFDSRDLLLGAPLALLAVLVVLALTRPWPTRPKPYGASAATTAGTVLALMVVAAPAAAHDPGQGEEAGGMELNLEAEGKQVAVTARALGEACDPQRDAQLVARRGGQSLRFPMQARGCRYEGTAEVTEEGRWFIYVELRGPQDTIESWLPMKVGQEERVSEVRRYAYHAEDAGTPLLEWIAGIALYGVMLVLLTLTAVFLRRRARASESSRRGPPSRHTHSSTRVV